MSRIGRKPVLVPAEVEIKLTAGQIEVIGPKGRLCQNIRPEVKVTFEDGKLIVECRGDNKLSRSLHGLTRSLIANMVEGVQNGFEKKLKLVGTGYRVKMEGSGIVLSVGFSHPVEFNPPEGIKLAVEGNNLIEVSGVDKGLVGQTAANIRSIRPPEPYKGKGIRYQDEEVKTKPGKAGKAGAAGFTGGGE